MEFNKDKVRDWINSYWTASHQCQICGENKWILLDNVWELRKFQAGSLALGSPVLPVVALMCNVCGHMVFFNAIAARAVPKPSTEGEQE